MLLIPIGSASRQLTFDATDVHHCPECDAPRDFALRLRYDWGSLFYVPVCVTERQYQRVCVACEHGWILERRSAEALLGGDPVPWMHRNGWMILAAMGVVVAAAFARGRGLP